MEQEYTTQKKSTPKIIPFLVFGALIAGLAYWAFSGTDKATTDATATTANTEQPQTTASSSDGIAPEVPINYDEKAFNAGICDWPEYITCVDFNNGLKDNPGSRFRKEFGLPVNFTVMNNFNQTRAALTSGAIDAVWGTIDSFSGEAEGLAADPTVAQTVIATDCSEGADLIIVTSDIKSVADLKGKTVAFAGLTPSNSFLLNTLQAAGLTIKDINPISTLTPAMAATVFKSGKADAVVLWKPEDAACLEDVEGSRVLISTKTASNLIYNVFLVRKEYLDQHEDRVVDFFTGWMKANAELKAGGRPARERLAKALVKYMKWPDEATAMADMDNGRFLTIGDNLNLFGMNKSFKGMKAKEIYSKFGAMYMASGDITNEPPAWSTVFDSRIIDKVAERLKGDEHKAEGRKEFTPATSQTIEEPALTHLSVTVNFATGNYKLDDKAKNIIKRQFGDAVKTNASARIRIVGNTDNTGSEEANRKLSKRRAQAVADYLEEEYDCDPNRFIVIGNGPKDAIANGVEGDNEEYRRTDFELLED
jgi:NitT/TauT family transport system substrate-binding protein